MKRLFPVLLLLVATVTAAYGEDEYAFDERELGAETEKKPYHVGGFAELRPVESWLNRDASLYKLNFYDSTVGERTDEYNGRVQLDGNLEYRMVGLYAKGNVGGRRDYAGNHGDATLYEGYGSLAPVDSFRVHVGKESLKWGKGYAWNPAALFTRPKNPDEPELDLEGYYLARFEYTRSFEGPLKTVSFTPVFLPVFTGVNEDYAPRQDLESAAKLYLLLFDTDLDFIYSYSLSSRSRFGFDFSRNITTNIEVHGEAAYLTRVSKTVLDDSGVVSVRESAAASFLAGIRYLNEADTTFIVEYYHNGAGRDTAVMKRQYVSINKAYAFYEMTGDDGLLQKISDSADTAIAKVNPMRDYAYARISQKDPFDILYVTPAVTWIYNTADYSSTLSPEIVYTGVTNLELRLKALFLIGEQYSESGEKPNKTRVELRVRYSF
ncbi:MAG TPA: hypothetical protein PKJ16_08635 [Spirochaetota bacterium]|nr:hypothetical protein [Spirochaetota bacterium]HOS38918.1 hypothetical protein [Spirochaetota bacterium]HPU88236.1 hypothetical protein [Spirochaetota bacterium]